MKFLQSHQSNRILCAAERGSGFPLCCLWLGIWFKCNAYLFIWTKRIRYKKTNINKTRNVLYTSPSLLTTLKLKRKRYNSLPGQGCVGFIIGQHSGHGVPHLGLVAQVEEAIVGKLEGQHVSGVLHKNVLPHVTGFGQSSASQTQNTFRKDAKRYSILILDGDFTLQSIDSLNRINTNNTSNSAAMYCTQGIKTAATHTII